MTVQLKVICGGIIFLVVGVLRGPSPGGASEVGESVNQTCQRDEQIEKFLSTHGVAKGVAAKALLAGVNVNDVNELCFEENSGLALLGAWHRLTTQIIARMENVDRGASIIPMPKTDAREFLGFVEGRLAVPVPDAWSRCLVSSRVNRVGDSLFSSQKFSLNLHSLKAGSPASAGRRSFPTVFIDTKSKPIEIRITGRNKYEGRDANVVLPQEIGALIEERKGEEPFPISGIASEEKAVIALQDAIAPGGEIFCVSTRRALGGPPKLYWRQKMDSYWASNPKGTVVWFSEMRIRKEQIYLFHCSDNSIGVECLSFETGRREFSFNSRVN